MGIQNVFTKLGGVRAMPPQRGAWFVRGLFAACAGVGVAYSIGYVWVSLSPDEAVKGILLGAFFGFLLACLLALPAAGAAWIAFRKPRGSFERWNEGLAYRERDRRVELRAGDVAEAWLIGLPDERWGFEVKCKQRETLVGAVDAGADPLALLASLGVERPTLKAFHGGDGLTRPLLLPFLAFALSILPSLIVGGASQSGWLAVGTFASALLATFWLFRSRRLLVGHDGVGYDGVWSFAFLPWESVNSARVFIRPGSSGSRGRTPPLPVLILETDRGETQVGLDALSCEQGNVVERLVQQGLQASRASRSPR